MRQAVIRTSDGFVVNVIELKSKANWPIPEGCYLKRAAKHGSPGDTWDGTTFVSPPDVEPEPTETEKLEARIAALEAVNEVAK